VNLSSGQVTTPTPEVTVRTQIEAAIEALLRRADADARGATAVEYAIIVSLIAAVIVVVVGLLGLATQDNFRSITDLLP
jgi:Flp pilus assembly pilin Flp